MAVLPPHFSSTNISEYHDSQLVFPNFEMSIKSRIVVSKTILRLVEIFRAVICDWPKKIQFSGADHIRMVSRNQRDESKIIFLEYFTRSAKRSHLISMEPV